MTIEELKPVDITVASFARLRDDYTVLRSSPLNGTYARFNYDLIIGDVSIRELVGEGVVKGSIDDSTYGAQVRVNRINIVPHNASAWDKYEEIVDRYQHNMDLIRRRLKEESLTSLQYIYPSLLQHQD